MLPCQQQKYARERHAARRRNNFQQYENNITTLKYHSQGNQHETSFSESFLLQSP
jgi:hypothetical protein